MSSDNDTKRAMHGRLIGFFGYKRAGKDTAVKLIEELGYDVSNLKFATPLKEMAAAFIQHTTDLPPEVVHGGALRDQHTQDIEYITGGKMTTVRQLLQWLGTECGRGMDADLWVRAMKRQLAQDDGRADFICITDCRFPNEMKLIQELGGRCVLVERPGLEGDGHASEEIPAGRKDFDAVLENIDNRDFFKGQVVGMLIHWGLMR